MATENVNQSGASAAADSAKEETATLAESTGPDTAPLEPQAAADATQTAPAGEAPADETPATAPASQEAATNQSPEPTTNASQEHSGDAEPSGAQDFSANPITVCLSGTGGTRPLGWPSSGFRGTPAMPSQVLDFIEEVKPLELHGFTLVDFLPDKMVLQQFKWDVKTQIIEDIDTLQPFRTTELPRPA